MNRDEAAERGGRICCVARATADRLGEPAALVNEAKAGRIHAPLGYVRWTVYLAAVVGRTRLPPARRRATRGIPRLTTDLNVPVTTAQNPRSDGPRSSVAHHAAQVHRRRGDPPIRLGPKVLRFDPADLDFGAAVATGREGNRLTLSERLT
jgi:hypothetical protein